MKDFLTLIDLCHLLTFNQGADLLDIGERRKQTSGILHRTESRGIESFKTKEGRVAYREKDILKLLSTARGKNKNLRYLNWQAVYNLHLRAEEAYKEAKDNLEIEKDKETPSRFYKRLKKLILETIEQRKSLQKLIGDYYKTLIEETQELKTNTLISIFMRHRKILQELAERELPRKGFFLSLKEGCSYREDLQEALVSFRIPERRKELFKAQQTIALREKNASLKPLPFPLEELDNFLSSLFRSKEICDHAIGFLLSTGRRSEELLRCGEFKALKKDHMLLSHIAKKRTIQSKIDFPVLWDSKTLLEELRVIRAEGVSYSKLYSHCVKHYGDIFPNLHSLRKLYGVYSYLRFSSHTKHFNLWLNEVMGHEEDSLAVSFNYSEYIVPSFTRGEKR